MTDIAEPVRDGFEQVRQTLLTEPDVDEGRIFHAHGLKANDRIFAMRMPDALVVKLPADRVSELIANGVGRPFTSGGGRALREWVAIPPGADADWLALAREALLSNREAGPRAPRRRRPATSDGSDR